MNEKNIKEDNNKYMKDLLNILNQFIEDVEDNDPDKNMIKDVINSISLEIYPNGIQENQKEEEGNEELKEEKKEKEEKEEIKEENKEIKEETKEEIKENEIEKKEEIIDKEKVIEGLKNDIKELEKKLEDLNLYLLYLYLFGNFNIKSI